jgi:hypothetical protein
MNEPRGNWYLLTGLLLGLAFGLLYSWVISPVKYVDTEPISLSATYKDEYRRVIALAYASTHDLGRASERLKLLDPGDSLARLVGQAQAMMAGNPQSPEAHALALLATNLGQPSAQTPTQPGTQVAAQFTQAAAQNTQAPVDTPTPTDTPEVVDAVRSPTIPVSPTPTISPTATITPTPTFTPRATATQAATQSAPFVLKEQKEICDGSIPAGRLVIEISDHNNNPLAGVQITVSWEGGENKFYTGLAPEVSPGYADFQMSNDYKYILTIGDNRTLISNITSSPNCAKQFKFSQ